MNQHSRQVAQLPATIYIILLIAVVFLLTEYVQHLYIMSMVHCDNCMHRVIRFCASYKIGRGRYWRCDHIMSTPPYLPLYYLIFTWRIFKAGADGQRAFTSLSLLVLVACFIALHHELIVTHLSAKNASIEPN